MIKIIVLNISVFIILLLIACSNEAPINPQLNKKYPNSAGDEWEYNTEMYLTFYDSSGIIYGTDTLNFGNTISRIYNVNDSVGNFGNLTLFGSYDLNTSNQISSIWYRNNDEGLVAIAYSSAGSSQQILPKRTTNFNPLDIAKIIKNSLSPFFDGFYFKPSADSIQFYEIPRKVLEYPLAIGIEWIELQVPFRRRRFVNVKENINTSIGNFYCYKIESEMIEFPNVTFTDYIDLEIGLVNRELKIDSMIHVVGSDTIGFFNSLSKATLVRKN